MFVSGLWVDLWGADGSQAVGPGFGLAGHRILILQSKEQTRGKTGTCHDAGWAVPNPQLRPVLTREVECVLCFIVHVF